MTPVLRLAELESVSLRIPWPHEAQHFTRWLRSNLDRLAEAIDVPLTAIDAKAVANAQIADLLARDERDGSMVVIENQLEPADDAHFGQIMTYAAGVDARTVVWVAERFSPAKLAAFRWLNAKAVIDFYAVRLRVVRIEESALAVMFEVIERPNRRPGSLGSTTAAEPLGDFAGAFWAAHLIRYPDEAKSSRAVGARCRWRATTPRGVVIAQRVEEHAASVFLRGRYGVTLSAVRAALAPFAGELADRLGVRPDDLGVRLDDDGSAALACKTLPIHVADPTKQAEASAWLRRQSLAYDAALRDLVRVGVGDRRDAGAGVALA